MRIATPDLVTNSYFPALAAEELGIYCEEGIDAHLELRPSLEAVKALRDGAADCVAGGAHTLLLAFPDWKGAKLGVTLSRGHRGSSSFARASRPAAVTSQPSRGSASAPHAGPTVHFCTCSASPASTPPATA